MLFLPSAEASAELIDLGVGHGTPVLAHHLGKVFRKNIGLFLEEEQRGSDRTQLAFINGKDEGFHLNLLGSKHAKQAIPA